MTYFENLSFCSGGNLEVSPRGIIKTLSNIYDGAFYDIVFSG